MNGQTFTYNPGLERNIQTFFLPLSQATSDWTISTVHQSVAFLDIKKREFFLVKVRIKLYFNYYVGTDNFYLNAHEF